MSQRIASAAIVIVEDLRASLARVGQASSLRAHYRGEQHDVHVRLADDYGAIYVSLADEARVA